jgi:hypothetical protein
MKRKPSLICATSVALLAAIALLAGCESSGSSGGSVDVHGSFYYGTGYGYPGYGGFYGPAYYPPPAVIVPPPIHGHPGGGGGGARPTPMPSMPAARPRGR